MAVDAQPISTSARLTEGATPGVRLKRLRRFVFGAALVAAAVLLPLCRYEIVLIPPGQLLLLPKAHFTLAESFVSLDNITGVPLKVAKQRWPLTCDALIRDGIVKPLPKYSPVRKAHPGEKISPPKS